MLSIKIGMVWYSLLINESVILVCVLSATFGGGESWEELISVFVCMWMPGIHRQKDIVNVLVNKIIISISCSLFFLFSPTAINYERFQACACIQAFSFKNGIWKSWWVWWDLLKHARSVSRAGLLDICPAQPQMTSLIGIELGSVTSITCYHPWI